MKHFILLMFFLSLASSLHARQIIDLSTGQVSNDSVLQAPEKDVEYVGDGIVVTYKIQKAALSEDDLYTGTFNLEIPGFSNCMELRMPGIPMGGDYYIVPKDSEPTVALVSAKYKDLRYELAPARWPMSLSDTVSYSKSNVPVIQPYSGFWPQVVVEELPAGMYRRQPIANAAINPVQYNYDSKTVRVYTEIKYKISFANNKSMADLEFEPGSLLNPNHKLPLKALQKSGSRIIERPLGSNIDANAGYLIISVPEFKETLQEFVKWKKRLGYSVTELYDAAWTPEKIKTAIRQQYDNDSTLNYMLIVGNHDQVPGDSIRYTFHSDIQGGYLITDFPYACIDGNNDIDPDIYRGRWPVGTTRELQIIIDKTIWYEQRPYMGARFYRRASHFSFFEDGSEAGSHDGIEDSRFLKSCEDVRSYLKDNYGYVIDRIYSVNYAKGLEYWPARWSRTYSEGGYLPDSLLHENGFNWRQDANHLVKAANEDGISYILFSGHGDYTGWGYGDYNGFVAKDIAKFRNYDRLPIIFSFSCLTGNYPHPLCPMRTFLVKENGGAIGGFAASNVSFYSTHGKTISLFINSIWPNPGLYMDMGSNGVDGNEGIYTPPSNITESNGIQQMGAILDYAMSGFDALTSQNRYDRQNHQCFGDPSMYFRTEQPEVLDDYIEVTRIEGGDGLRVFLKDGKKAYIAFYDPIDDKVVRKYGDEASYFTNDLGGAKYVDVVVYTENCVPYMNLGENYYGVIDPQPSVSTRFLGYSNIGGGVIIDYYMSSSAAEQGVEICIQDVISGQIESTWPLSRDGVCDQKASIGMQCSSGVKVAYMVVGGVPQSNTMKMFVSR